MFQQNLKRLLEEGNPAGIKSQHGLAKRLAEIRPGTTKSGHLRNVSRWLVEGTLPTWENVEAVAEALQVPIDELVPDPVALAEISRLLRELRRGAKREAKLAKALEAEQARGRRAELDPARTTSEPPRRGATPPSAKPTSEGRRRRSGA